MTVARVECAYDEWFMPKPHDHDPHSSQCSEPASKPPPGAGRATGGQVGPTSADIDESLIEKPLRDTNPIMWLLTLIGPFALTAAILVLLWGAYGWDFMAKLASLAVVTFFFFGRFIIVLGHTGNEVDGLRLPPPQQLALMVLYMDLMVATLLTCHLGFLFRLPWLGWRLRELVNDGRFILDLHPWIRKVTFLGVVAFVTFPLAATGSVGGSIFGRLLGMTRLATFIGVALGSMIGCGIMYAGAEIINEYVLDEEARQNPFVFWGGVAIVAVLILLLNHRYRQLKKSHMDRVAAEREREKRRQARADRRAASREASG